MSTNVNPNEETDNPNPDNISQQPKSRREFLKYSVGAVAIGAASLPKLPSIISSFPKSQRFSFAAKPTTKITMWHILSPSASGPAYGVLKKLAAEFQTKYKIEVVLDFVQFNEAGSFVEKVDAAAASSNPPDVAMLSGASNYAYTGAARPLNGYVSSSSVIKESDWIPGQWARDVWEGQLYGIPIGADANALFFWNRDLFKSHGMNPDAPPATWDELLEFSKRFYKPTAGKKVDLLGFIPTYGQSWNLVYYYLLGPQFMLSDSGGATWKQGNSSPKVLFNDQFGVTALDFVVKLSDANGGAQLLSTFSQGFTTGLQDPFITGRMAMEVNGAWQQPYYAQYAPHLNYGVSAMPLPPNGVECSTSGGFSWCIPVKAGQPDAAWSWVEFASQPDNQLALVKGWGTNPTRVSLLSDPYFLSNPVRKAAVRAIKNARGWGEGPWGSILWTQYMLNARDNAIYHKMSVHDALNQAATTVEQAVRSYT
jgi:multiple sugar transport system substrate-binding protein